MVAPAGATIRAHPACCVLKSGPTGRLALWLIPVNRYSNALEPAQFSDPGLDGMTPCWRQTGNRLLGASVDGKLQPNRQLHGIAAKHDWVDFCVTGTGEAWRTENVIEPMRLDLQRVQSIDVLVQHLRLDRARTNHPHGGFMLSA